MALEYQNRVFRLTLAAGLAGATLLQANPGWAGSLVLVGGNWAYPGLGGEEEAYGVPIYQEIVDRAGGIENARIGILTTASTNPSRSAGFYIEDFEILFEDYYADLYPGLSGFDVEWIPITYDLDTNTCATSPSDASVIEQIGTRNAFIFGGGDQSFITSCFFEEDPVLATRTETPLLTALKEQYAKGAVIAGTSAGTAVQPSAPMITNGESYESFVNGPISFIGSPPFDNELYYNPLGGLGFFDYGLLDSHFSERGRQGRIIRLAEELDIDLAFGVDENTALLVTESLNENGEPEVLFEVMGQGGIFISDLSEAIAGEKDGFWTISGVRATYLTEGDTFDPLSRTATFGDKVSLNGLETLDGVPVEENIFSYLDDEEGWTNQRAFTETAIDLFNSNQTTAFGRSFEDDPVQYGVRLRRGAGSSGYVGLDSLGNPVYSFEGLEISIEPVPEPGTILGLLSVGVAGLGAGLRRKSS